ncbi:cytochrome P450 [Abortiporus biennis]|nr:cytochrome P450 [Abortiporus biennis]
MDTLKSMDLPPVDAKLAVFASSFVTYLIYKKFEPNTPLSALLLLGVIPGAVATYVKDDFSSVYTAYPAVFASYWSLIVAFVCAYRLSPLHPLAKYPGPIMCKLTKLGHVYLYTQRKHFGYVSGLHKKYGDVVRIGPNELSFVDGNTCLTISKDLPKGPYYDSRQQEHIGSSLDGLRDMGVHARRRKPWTKAMSKQALSDYGEILQNKMVPFLSALKKKQGERLDILEWLRYYTFDFMGLMIFNVDFDMIGQQGDPKGFWDIIHNANGNLALVAQIPWAIPFLRLFPPAMKSLNILKEFSQNTVRQRLRDGSKKRDVVSYLIGEDSEFQNDRLTNEEAIADGILAIVGGSDSTSMVLVNAFYYLFQTPSMYKRLQQEIEDYFPNGKDAMDTTKLAEMPYLNACINESMRLLGPGVIGIQKRVPEGSGGKMIGPYFVPEATQVSALPYSIYRDGRYFYPLPTTFWPDRWLLQDKFTLPNGDLLPKEDLKMTREIFTPFQIGAYSCAGKAVALLETRYVLTTLVQHFDMSVADGYRLDFWEDNIVEEFLQNNGPMEVVLKARV